MGKRGIAIRSVIAPLVVPLLLFLSTCLLSCGGISSATNTSSGPSVFASCELREEDGGSFGVNTPPLLVRHYRSGMDKTGILGPDWSCWPFDVALKTEKVDEYEVIRLIQPGRSEQVFVPVSENEYGPLDLTAAGRKSLTRSTVGYRLVDRQQGNLTFDKAGWLVELSDQNGNNLRIERDSSSLPLSLIVEWPHPIKYKLECDPARRTLATVSKPEGQVWRYTYDGEGRLASVIQPDNFSQQYEYQTGRLVRMLDSVGRSVAFRYDDSGRLVETDRNGRKETRKYIILSSSSEDWKATILDPIGRTIEYQKLKSKNQVVIREKSGEVLVRQYDEEGRLAHASSLERGVTSYFYDGPGRLVGVLAPTGGLTSFEYNNAMGLPSAVQDSFGQRTEYNYNAAGQPVLTRFPDGREVKASYNKSGLPKTLQDSKGEEASFHYDERGLLTEIQDNASGDTVKVAPSSTAALVRALRPPAFKLLALSAQRAKLLNSLAKAETHTPSSKGNLTSKLKTAGGEEWTCTYDLFGNPVRLQESGQSLAEMKYDMADRLVEITYADSTHEQFEYNAGDQVIRYVDPKGRECTYQYDTRGNLTKAVLPPGEERVFSYDDAGRLVSAFNASYHDVFAYDDKGRLSASGRLTPTSQGPEALATYTYDHLSRLKSAKYSDDLRCDYGLNDDDTMETIKVRGIKLVLNRAEKGQCTALYLPDNMKCEFGYTENGDLMRLALRNKEGESVLNQYGQYQDGRLIKVTTTMGATVTQHNLEYLPTGALAAKPWLEPDESRGEAKESRDALGRLRVSEANGVKTEFQYARGGVCRISTDGTEAFVLRSAEGMPRLLARGQKTDFLIPSALPGQAFLVDTNSASIQAIRFDDGTSPTLVISSEHAADTNKGNQE